MNLRPDIAICASLLGAMLLASTGCAQIGGDDENVAAARQADSVESSNFSLPPSGGYSYYLLGGTWGTGSANGEPFIPFGTSVAVPSIATSGGQPRTFSSFEMCNNLGAAHEFKVLIYSDFEYTTPLKAYPTFKVLNGACQVVNVGAGSSFTVGSLTITF